MRLRTDGESFFIVDMSNSVYLEVLIPVVEVESISLTSTSVDRPADESSSTSSEESMNIEAGQTQPASLEINGGQTLPTRLDTDNGIIRVLSVQASKGGSFEGLTIPVAIP